MQLAGICGQNSSTGVITNCIVSGNIEIKMLFGQTAGVAPYSSGSVQNCGNYSNIHVEIVSEREFNKSDAYILIRWSSCLHVR